MYHRMLFDLIGKLFFSRQPHWRRRYNAKILVVAAILAIILALVLVSTMFLINKHFYK